MGFLEQFFEDRNQHMRIFLKCEVITGLPGLPFLRAFGFR